MRKLVACLLAMVLTLGACALPVSADLGEIITDEASGITFEVFYRSTISNSWSAMLEGRGPWQAGGTNQLENLWSAPRSDEVKNTIKKLEDNSINFFAGLEHNSAVTLAERSLMDGYEYHAPTESSNHYWTFFGLDKTFRGTTVIKKDDVPFTVTVNNNGDISFKIVTDYVGEKKAEFFQLATLTYEKEVTEKEEYTLSSFSTKPFDSLEDAMNFCINNAHQFDTSKPIRIWGDYTYDSRFKVHVSESYKYIFTYGNSKAPTTTGINGTTTTTTTSAVTTEDGTETTTTAENVTETQTTSAADVPADTSDFPFAWVIAGVAVCALAAAALLFLKRRNN